MIRKPYSTYKNSSVPWLGQVPEHWEVLRVKHLCRLVYGDSLPAESRQGGTVPVFGSNGRVGFHGSPNTKSPSIIIGRKGSFGKVNFSPVPAYAIDTTFFVDDRFANGDIGWLFYLLGWLRLDEVSKDSAIPGLDRGDVYNRVAPTPPIAEQMAIARFLGHADRRIQRYIRAKKKLIALLNEQKQVTILRAVTRGLNPNVRLKPSGMEWLGDVPEHWEVRPVKYFYQEVDERSATGTEELLSVSHLTGVTPRSQKNVTMFMASSYAGHKICRPGDVVINTMWAWMAALGVAKQMGLVSPAYGVYRPLKASQLLGDYVDLLLRTRPYVSEYLCRSTGIQSSRLRLYPEHFLRLRLVFPPAEEQRLILDYIKAETSAADQAIMSAGREISLLGEYRTRLIADVMTGKLDVRDAAAQLPEETEEPGALEESDVMGEEEAEGEGADLDTEAMV